MSIKQKIPFLQKLTNILVHWPRSLFWNIKYGFPSRKMTLIGVTGTDGKTTTTILIHQMLKNYGFKVGLISTLGAKIEDDFITTGLHTTSPNPAIIQKLLYQMKQAGITHVVLEVTSHALDQYRYWGCNFQIGIFTNLAQEHLDYHKTMDKYLLAKSKLLKQSTHPVANSDNQYFPKLKKLVGKKILTFGLNDAADLRAINLELKPNSLSFQVDKQTFSTNSPYAYQTYNILASLAVAKLLGIPYTSLQQTIKDFPETKGRREEIANELGIRCIIDFAHTPQALESTLQSIKTTNPNQKIITVFGATGGRDPGKRPLMGQIVSNLSNITIITSDDTRNEKIENIATQIQSGINSSVKKLEFTQPVPTKKELLNAKKIVKDTHIYIFIPNRQDAITTAILLAQKGDIVITCGKGHEQTMLLGKTEYPWSESEAIRTGLNIRQNVLK